MVSTCYKPAPPRSVYLWYTLRGGALFYVTSIERWEVRGDRIARIESASMESSIFVSLFELPWDGV